MTKVSEDSNNLTLSSGRHVSGLNVVTVRFVAELLFSHVLRWAGNVGHVGKEEMLTEFWWRKLILRNNFEDLNVDRNIILS
jgi:hypothetical protein